LSFSPYGIPRITNVPKYEKIILRVSNLAVFILLHNLDGEEKAEKIKNKRIRKNGRGKLGDTVVM